MYNRALVCLSVDSVVVLRVRYHQMLIWVRRQVCRVCLALSTMIQGAQVVAIYRMEVKIIGRSKGHSACAAAAYRSGDKIKDGHYGKTRHYPDHPPSALEAAAYRSGTELVQEGTQTTHDYTRKSNVLHSEILAPAGADDWVFDRQQLWNRVEAKEDTSTRPADAQLARELVLTLPRELSHAQHLTLLRRFLQQEYVSKGMVADVAVHCPSASTDSPIPMPMSC